MLSPFAFLTHRSNSDPMRERKDTAADRDGAEAFLPRQDGKDVVNHKDYDVTNNRVDNLEWVTQKENVQYSASRMQHPKASCPKTVTGFKYIGIQGERYRVQIRTKKHGTYDEKFIDLQEAIAKRNEVMALWQIV